MVKGIIGIFFIPMIVSAQSSRDVVYLKSGSILKGELTEQGADQLRLEMADGSIWALERAEVVKIEQEEVVPAKRQVHIPKTGFYNQTDVGIMVGSSGWHTIVSPSFQSVSGYSINEHFAAGLGVGIEYFDDALAPVFAEGRYTLFKGRTSPYVSTKLGYAIPLNNYKVGDQWGQKGGITAGALLGIRHHFNSSLGLTISAGYRFQSNTVVQQWWWFNEGDQMRIYQRYNRIAFRIGLLFR